MCAIYADSESEPEPEPESWEAFITMVEQAARDYVEGDRKQTTKFRAKWLDLPGDPSTRRIGKALVRLEDRDVIERTEHGYDSGLKWRICDDREVCD